VGPFGRQGELLHPLVSCTHTTERQILCGRARGVCNGSRGSQFACILRVCKTVNPCVYTAAEGRSQSASPDLPSIASAVMKGAAVHIPALPGAAVASFVTLLLHTAEMAQFQDTVKKLVEGMNKQGARIEAAKLKSLGQRNRVESEKEVRKIKKAELESLIKDKKDLLERLQLQVCEVYVYVQAGCRGMRAE